MGVIRYTVRSSNKFQLYLALLAPLIIFLYFYDYGILIPWNINWLMGGDLGTNFIGWHAFRYDEWRFPITKTELLAWPHGVPIIFTDSNPLFAIILKLFSPILPRVFQYIGLWYLICLILQSTLGYFIGYKITGSTNYGLLFAIFLCLYPPLLTRWGHAQLMGHWVILCSIYIFLFIQDSRRVFFLSVTITILSIAIHLYLTAMILPILLASYWFVLKCLGLEKFKKFSIYVFSIFFISLFELYLLGYFTYGDIGGGGFGDYSMNLNAPFNSRWQSTFLPGLPWAEFQYEGYQYVGLGGIFLILLGLCGYIFFIRKNRCLISNKIAAIIIICALFSIFALSNKIMLGSELIFKYDLPIGIDLLANAFRSSGRFLWPVSYLLFVFSVYYIWNSFPRLAIGLLFSVCVVQLIDIAPLGNAIGKTITLDRSNVILREALEPFISDADAVFIDGTQTDLQVASYESSYMGSPLGLPLISIYSSRAPKEHYLWETNLKQSLMKGDTSLKNVMGIFPAGWHVCFPQRSFYVMEDWSILLPENTVSKMTDKQIFNLVQDQPVKPLDVIIDSCKSDCVIAIAAMDDAALNFPKKAVASLVNIKSEIEHLRYRDSLIILIENGSIIYENMGQELLKYDNTVSGRNLNITSAGSMVGNTVRIMIDNINYAHGRRGINLVIFSGSEEPKSYSFDTHLPDCNIK